MTLLVNAYSTLRDPPPLGFAHERGSRRDRSDPELSRHLEGFVGFVLRENPAMNATLYATLRHIQRVQTQLSFEIEPPVLDALAEWAWRANAILFVPDGSVLNPAGDELVDARGAPHEAELPYPEDALRRRERSVAKLSELGIRTPASLPPVVGEGEVTLRSARDVALRSLALLAVAVRAESLASGDSLPVAELREKLPPAFGALSPIEREFMGAEAPERQAVVNHVWRYEALFVLEWALGLFEEMRLPAGICDVPAVAGALFGKDLDAFVDSAVLRPTSEILDAFDLHFRLHWAARQAVHVEHTEPPAGMDLGVLQERRHAENWLVRFEDAEWDAVDTPT